MRRLQSFWGSEVAHFGPLDGPLSMDLEVPFFRLKLGRTSTLTMFISLKSIQPILTCRFISKNFALQTTVQRSDKADIPHYDPMCIAANRQSM